MINTIGILFLWFKCVYYLRIWDDTNYLASMVVKVMIDMRWFLLIYFMSHFAFGHAFYRLSNACLQFSFSSRPENFTFPHSVFYSFMLSIGEFAIQTWNIPMNKK
jgi:hypothetical protein